jgi:hypothetical protein
MPVIEREEYIAMLSSLFLWPPFIRKRKFSVKESGERICKKFWEDEVMWRRDKRRKIFFSQSLLSTPWVGGNSRIIRKVSRKVWDLYSDNFTPGLLLSKTGWSDQGSSKIFSTFLRLFTHSLTDNCHCIMHNYSEGPLLLLHVSRMTLFSLVVNDQKCDIWTDYHF